MGQLIRGVVYLPGVLLIGAICFLLFESILVILKNRRLSFRLQYIYEYIFIVYLLLVGMITGIFNFSLWRLETPMSFNLVPFVKQDGWLILLNVMLLIPLGVLVPLTIKKISWNTGKVLICGLTVSLVIELIQFFFVGRVADIDDVITNTVGTLIGYALFNLVLFLKNTYQGDRKMGMGTLSVVIVFLCVVWSFPYQRLCMGDVILSTMGLPIWSGDQPGVFSFEGFHYTLLYSLAISILAFFLAKRYPEHLGSRIGEKLSIISFIYLVLLLLLQSVGKHHL